MTKAKDYGKYQWNGADWDRFWAKVDKTDAAGCWIWLGYRNDQGYGIFTKYKEDFRAHRIAFIGCLGSIPEDTEIDHLCRNRCCVNPRHLEVVPHKINVSRGKAGLRQRQQTHCKHGHLLAEPNLLYSSRDHRVCRECSRLRSEKQRRNYPERARTHRKTFAKNHPGYYHKYYLERKA